MDDKVYLGIVWLEGKIYETINTGEVTGKIEYKTKYFPLFIQHGSLEECKKQIDEMMTKIKENQDYKGSIYESDRII